MTLTFDLETGAQSSTCSTIYTQQRQPGASSVKKRSGIDPDFQNDP